MKRSPASRFFAPFDRIRVVNLVERTDRRREMEVQFARVGLAGDPRIRYFPAIRTDHPGPFRRIGSHGNFLARIELLREAAQAGEAVLILEDDCDFLTPQVFEAVLPEGWDIVYGGFESSNEDALSDSMIIGSHCMGFSARAATLAADYLVRYMQPDFPPDPVAAADPAYDPAIRPPIDGAFVWFRRAHPELVTVFRKVAVQRASRTDVGDQRFFDRIPVLRSLAGVARAIKRRIAGSRGMKSRNLGFDPGPVTRD